MGLITGLLITWGIVSPVGALFVGKFIYEQERTSPPGECSEPEQKPVSNPSRSFGFTLPDAAGIYSLTGEAVPLGVDIRQAIMQKAKETGLAYSAKRI